MSTTTYTVQHCVLTCIYGLVDAIESHIHVHEILLVVRHQVHTMAKYFSRNNDRIHHKCVYVQSQLKSCIIYDHDNKTSGLKFFYDRHEHLPYNCS